jgi:hypothetical protein
MARDFTALTAALALAAVLLVPAAASERVDWGTGFDSFRDTCAEIGGVRTGMGFGATCAYDGDVLNVTAGSRGWTVDVAYATVATWLGGANVSEEPGDGTIIACYNPGGQQMDLSHRHCVIGE